HVLAARGNLRTIGREDDVIDMPAMPCEDMQRRHFNSGYPPSFCQWLGSRGSSPFRPFNQDHRAMFKAKLLRILRLLPTHCFIQVVVERAQGNAPGTRIGSLTLQSIEQVGHNDTMPLLHLSLGHLSNAEP